ncbi:MAG: FkbM family methyltransferase [Acetobacteraceae bacterium]|nr:FkbM family methyltransferase [Acetobacteraceae bacterium]
MRVAAFTMVYNEPIFLPLWCGYYGHAVGEENLFVLDHGSNDGSTDDLGMVQKVRIPRVDKFDEDHRASFISRFQATLLSAYDAVVFSDVDEFLIPDPEKFSGLSDFIQHRCPRFVNAVGLDLLHVPDEEAGIDLRAPILSQRHYVRFSPRYCKPLISRIPLLWQPGFHACDYPPAIDPDLFLFHLKRMDRDLSVSRLRQWRAIEWSDNSLSKGHGYQTRLDDREFLAREFPFSGESIRSVLVEGFDFSPDIERRAKFSADLHLDADCRISVIPEKFGEKIAIIPTASAKAYLHRAHNGIGTEHERNDAASERPVLPHGEWLQDKLVVVDIGAAGGLQQPWTGVEDRIVAVMFEPNPIKAAELRSQPHKFADLIVVESALGNRDGTRKLNLTKSFGCASLLTPNRLFLQDYSVCPAFDVIQTLDIEITSYGSLFRSGRVPTPDVIKIDTQGFEFEVLLGFGDLLGSCLAVQLEAHFYQIYQGQKLFGELVGLLKESGLVLRSIKPVNHFDGDIVEIDAWFTISEPRERQLSDVDKWKFSAIENEWELPTRTKQFAPTTWD